MIGKILEFLGLSNAAIGSQACSIFWLDEPKMPKSMIK